MKIKIIELEATGTELRELRDPISRLVCNLIDRLGGEYEDPEEKDNG